MAQISVAGERHIGACQATATLDPHRPVEPRAVDHDLVHVRVGQQWLQRPEAERPPRDPRGEVFTRAGVQHAGVTVDQRANASGQRDVVAACRSGGAGLGQQALTEAIRQVFDVGHARLRRDPREVRPGCVSARTW
ncbi:hypothetical protein [Baekduia sp. Peel2402]|uniref:hypothetical protein n=1 Tax=Baekduia sp. Peel2402 TaxID=3458296 RepID=UPI00403ED223